MYTDEDLNTAIEKGIFTKSSVVEFRRLIAGLNGSPSVDEENFKLVGGFNDIFVVIACGLLLVSAFWVFQAVYDSLGLAVFAMLSWVLAEFFVRKRKMALPAIALLLAFVGSVFLVVISLSPNPDDVVFTFATAVSTLAAILHWRRFRVPITVAVGTAAALGLAVTVITNAFPESKNILLLLAFLGGIVAFTFAMYWDSSDTKRTSYKSDVAFWLHLLSAPLIIHPVFSSLGVLEGNESLGNMLAIVALYVLMTGVSIAIDRRVFMVSSLVYVVYALSSLIENYGGVGYSFAATGVVVGGALLLLSAYWHRVRALILTRLPDLIQQKIP
ncbi:hypothetical protein [Marinomonas transparens]|uniref:Uncharacterized protein n=1 Tax=Marinomonas transparens TaxID=2795388 RepID=A0A934JN89_9GAMM|nr:hypothetical protein [Marinomonas transparens]MBJ7539355.1 hypothetical protein [Marinomonas transparens]